MAAADSAASDKKPSRTPGGRGRRNSSRSRARVDTARVAVDSAQGTPSRSRRTGSLDRRGYVGNRLDLDIATAAQIDSLPGITPTIAKRIAADRMKRGPFLDLDGLRRVSGIGPTLIKRLDSLVTFSGVYTQGVPGDSMIAPRRRAKPKRPTG